MRRNAPGIRGSPGAASFPEDDFVNPALRELYLRNERPVAFLDESYRLDGDGRYYILSCALVWPDALGDTRQALRDYYGGDAMHASEMFGRAEVESLRKGIRLAAGQHDGMDLVVFAPVTDSDRAGAAARAACIAFVAPLIQAEAETRLFVFDRLARPSGEQADQATFASLRRNQQLHRDSTVIHVRPSEEPILGLPDLLAWAYRQEYARGVIEWFEPLRKDTRVHLLQ